MFYQQGFNTPASSASSSTTSAYSNQYSQQQHTSYSSSSSSGIPQSQQQQTTSLFPTTSTTPFTSQSPYTPQPQPHYPQTQYPQQQQQSYNQSQYAQQASSYQKGLPSTNPLFEQLRQHQFPLPAPSPPIPQHQPYQYPQPHHHYQQTAYQQTHPIHQQQKLVMKVQQAQQALLHMKQKLHPQHNASSQIRPALFPASQSPSPIPQNNTKKDQKEAGNRPFQHKSRGRRRHPSPPPNNKETMVLPNGDLTESVRKYKHLAARYPNMYVPTDFSFVENTWVSSVGNSSQPSHRPFFITQEVVDFEVTNKIDEVKASDKDVKQVKQETSAKQTSQVPADSFSASGKRYNVRVALVNGVPTEDLFNTSLPHLCRQLKFVVQEKIESDTSKYLALIGGMWNKEDGGDPDTDLSSLVNTAIRTTKNFLGVNLAHALKWSVLGKIHYVRPQEERHGKLIPKHDDITVILLPHLDHVCSSLHLKERSGENSNIDTKSLERLAFAIRKWDPPGVMAEHPTTAPQQGNGASSLTLIVDAMDAQHKDGQDTSNISGVSHTEGEGFVIRIVTKSDKSKARFISLDGLLDYRSKDTMERTFEVSMCAELIKEMLQRYFGDTIYDHLVSMPEQLEKQEPASQPKERKRERERDSETDDAKAKEAKKDEGENKYDSGFVVTKPWLFAAYRFFDRSDKSFLFAHDLEEVLHSLGHNLTQKQVRSLVDKSSTPARKIFYKKQTHVSVSTKNVILPINFIDLSEAKEAEMNPLSAMPYGEANDCGTLPTATPTSTALDPAAGNYMECSALLARLQKSEQARRQAVQDASRATEQLHRVQLQIEDSERKNKELLATAQSSNALLAAKTKEFEKYKSVVLAVKSALQRVNDDHLTQSPPPPSSHSDLSAPPTSSNTSHAPVNASSDVSNLTSNTASSAQLVPSFSLTAILSTQQELADETPLKKQRQD